MEKMVKRNNTLKIKNSRKERKRNRRIDEERIKMLGLNPNTSAITLNVSRYRYSS